jgi:hypothetical protein
MGRPCSTNGEEDEEEEEEEEEECLYRVRQANFL